MDTSGLVSAVLHLLTQGASGAASAAGGIAAEALITALRERLGRTDDGRAALDAFLGDPGNAANTATVRAILAREVASDPGFGRYLEAVAAHAAVQQPQAAIGGVVIGGGAKASRSQISLGPVTINNDRQGRRTLAVAAIALVMVVALAVYGGLHVIADENGGARSDVSAQGGSKSTGHDPLPADRRTADAILLDGAAMEGNALRVPARRHLSRRGAFRRFLILR